MTNLNVQLVESESDIRSLAQEVAKDLQLPNYITSRKHKRSIEIKALALTLVGMGYRYRDVGEKLGVTSSTVSDWVNDMRTPDEQEQLRSLSSNIKKTMSDKFYVGASKLFAVAMEDKKLDKASTLQLTTAASQLIDKARLLDGDSTENIGMVIKRYESAKTKGQQIDEELDRLNAQLSQFR